MTREEAEKTCVLWSCDDAEDGLQAASPDEAIEDFLEDYYNHALGPVVVFPPTLTLQGYVRMKPKARTLASRPGSNFGPVAGLLDALDEEYGDPDGNETKPTASMMEAERVFIEAVLTMIGQAPASARQAGVPGALLRPGLVLHVLAKNLNRGTAGRDEAVAWRPEDRLSAVGGTQRGELLSQKARGDRLA